ncbi:hypothetical protein DMUE_3060 [Dictyocoela muelleri]|nr:hypothetical protein DMUE_3060 [Dictyocoela muelleri]
MNYTRKVLTLIPINRNSDQNKIVRNQYGSFISNIRNDQLIFIDETGFNLHLAPKFGYSQRNTKCYVNVPNSKGSNVSLLCAINIQGILAYKIKVGSFKSIDFLSYINNVLPSAEPNDRICIVMDNASIHKTSDVLQALYNRGYMVKFLPPYSPQLNHIEEFFSSLKSRFILRPRCKNSAC